MRSSWVAVKSVVDVVLELAAYGSVVFLTFLGLGSFSFSQPGLWELVDLLAFFGLLLWAVQLVWRWHSFWIDYQTARAWEQDGLVLPEARG